MDYRRLFRATRLLLSPLRLAWEEAEPLLVVGTLVGLSFAAAFAPWSSVSLVTLIGIVFALGVVQAYRSIAAEANVRFVEPSTNEVPLTNLGTRQHMGTPFFVLAYFADEPPTNGKGEDAKQLHARIRVDGIDREIVGTWGENAAPLLGQETVRAELDLPCTGVPRPLNIGLKHPEDAAFYFVDNQTSGRSRGEGWRDPRFKVGPGTYGVEVTIRARNVRPKRYKFELENPEQGEPELRLLESPDE